MHIEKMINKAKEILLWIYIAAFLAGIVYAACMGQEAKTPGEIFYEKTHIHPCVPKSPLLFEHLYVIGKTFLYIIMKTGR